MSVQAAKYIVAFLFVLCCLVSALVMAAHGNWQASALFMIAAAIERK